MRTRKETKQLIEDVERARQVKRRGELIKDSAAEFEIISVKIALTVMVIWVLCLWVSK